VRYSAPETVDEACHLTASYGDSCKVLAGGQSLGPLLNLRLAAPEVLVDLGRIPSLAAPMSHDGTSLTVPAMTRQHGAETSDLVRTHVPLLAQAAPYIAHRTIRNRGTVGGSIAHADPSAEIPAVAVATKARLTVRSTSGSRVVAAEEFFDGYFTTVMEPDEILTDISFPARQPHEGSAWTEFAPRRGDFALVGVGVILRLDGAEGDIAECRIVCSGIVDRPWLATKATSDGVGEQPSKALFAHVADEAARTCSPMDDALAPANYRRNLVRHLTAAALDDAWRRTREGQD
jgi:CO/xanthine dehydrogenase FAD-binding subunit